ncbi:MAG TPA: hypothetical protein TECP_01122 [Hyphomicrobiaceae bacterium MAG_BT-2024]
MIMFVLIYISYALSVCIIICYKTNSPYLPFSDLILTCAYNKLPSNHFKIRMKLLGGVKTIIKSYGCSFQVCWIVALLWIE